MIATTVLALLLRQGPAPTLAAGTSPEFAKLALAVEGKLVEGDVAGARELAKGLPVRNPRFAWADEATLPPALRDVRTAALERVVGSWARYAKGFASQEGGAPDLTVGFAASLPEGPDGLPLATQVQTGPPFRATLNVYRGKPGLPIRREDLTQELAYAFGRYLGVPEAPFPGSSMHRDARPNLLTAMPQPSESKVAGANLDLAERLRAGIAAGKPIGLVVPTVHLPKAALDLGEVRQGQPIRARLEIENVGAGPLDFRIEPDCSCFSPFLPGHLDPQGRASAAVIVNTEPYIGRQDKVLLLLTNDPARPQIEVPVTFYARPAYRMFRPGGPNVVVPDAGGAYDVFLFTDPSRPFRPTGASWSGIEGKVVSVAPWTGTLADPEMKEGPTPRKGWRFRVRILPTAGLGEVLPGTLTVTTDSAQFGTLLYSMTAQRGIAVDAVVLGDVALGTKASFLVSRPNLPFKILGVDAGKAFRATWGLRKPGEYQVDLEYLGGSQKGDLKVPITIRTDDPKQVKLETLVSGNVK